MANGKLKTASSQRTIFDFLREQEPAGRRPGKLAVQAHLRNAIKQALKKCPLSRWQIAGEMSDLLDQEITKYQLDHWTCESKEQHRFPAEYLPAFCQAVGSTEPLRLLAEAVGVFVVPGQEALRAEIQRLDEAEKELKSERRRRLAFLQEMERVDR